MCLAEKLLGCHNVVKLLFNYFLKNIEAAKFSIKKFFLLKTNSGYCQIFKSTYFEEHLQMAASENVFMKLRKIRIYSKEALILH